MAYIQLNTAAEEAGEFLEMTAEEAESMDREFAKIVSDIRIYQAQTQVANEEIKRLSAESQTALAQLMKSLKLS